MMVVSNRALRRLLMLSLIAGLWCLMVSFSHIFTPGGTWVRPTVRTVAYDNGHFHQGQLLGLLFRLHDADPDQSPTNLTTPSPTRFIAGKQTTRSQQTTRLSAKGDNQRLFPVKGENSVSDRDNKISDTQHESLEPSASSGSNSFTDVEDTNRHSSDSNNDNNDNNHIKSQSQSENKPSKDSNIQSNGKPSKDSKIQSESKTSKTSNTRSDSKPTKSNSTKLDKPNGTISNNKLINTNSSTNNTKPIMKTVVVTTNKTVRYKDMDQSAKEIAGWVREIPPDVHMNGKDSSFFVLRKHVVTDISPQWLLQPSPCPTEKKEGGRFLLVAIPTVDRHKLDRKAIRETWASMAYQQGRLNGSAYGQDNSTMDVVKVVFFAAVSDFEHMERWKNKTLPLMDAENNVYHDLAVSDTKDTYGNLSWKMATVLQWANDYCPSADYVIKVDEDTIVNVPLLLKVLENVSRSPQGSRPYVMGHPHLKKDPTPSRNGRWMVETKVYPLKYYPRYVYGHSYVISGDAIPLLRHASRHMPVVPNEDMYVTGILAKTMNVTRLSCTKMAHLGDSRYGCSLPVNDVISQTGYKSTFFLYQIWERSKSANKTATCTYTHQTTYKTEA